MANLETKEFDNYVVMDMRTILFADMQPVVMMTRYSSQKPYYFICKAVEEVGNLEVWTINEFGTGHKMGNITSFEEAISTIPWFHLQVRKAVDEYYKAQ